MGEKTPELNLTMCNKFEPIVLEGQLCYSLDIVRLTKKESKAGKTNGLFLLLDPNAYWLNVSDEMSLKYQMHASKPFKVFVHTLSQFRAHGPGTFAMSSLKKMKGTTNFKELPENQKRCRVHIREECQTKNFLDQVLRTCECVPWQLMGDTSLKEVENTFKSFVFYPTR